ncbi:MAG: leucyl aminopeptidase [bacterium]
MLFEIKSVSKQIEYKFEDKSAALFYIEENEFMEESLGEIEKNLGIAFNKNQSDSFFKKEIKQLCLYNTPGFPDIVYVQLIEKEKLNLDFFRNHAAGFIKKIKDEPLSYLHVFVPEYSNFKDLFPSEQYFYQTIIEGFHLGNYTFDKYFSEENKNKNKSKKLNMIFESENLILFEAAIEKTEHLIDSINFAKDLVNEPAITLTPHELAKRTKKELEKIDVHVRIFDEDELAKRNMHAILSVGGASANKPLMLVMNYKPAGKNKKKIALVGKGVTYDAGGLSIKPTAAMLEMKADMAGAALVIGAIKAAALLKLPVELIGIVPAVENVISGSSYKPGDVIITSSGKSIEVKDTDAEGRIVLSDALIYASKQKPDLIIDFATLTGAIAVALGLIASGLFTKNDELADDLLAAGNRTHERLWRMPFWDDYKKSIESDIADVSNLGPKWGGAITAGKFLEHFVDEKIPWAHLDIAGPAIKHEATNYTEKYDTGFGVRLMVEYLQAL